MASGAPGPTAAAPSAAPLTAPPQQRLFPLGFEVLCTAVHQAEREALQAVAREHGVQLLSSVRKTPPHVVITRSVRSPKYRLVMRTNPEVPVVKPDWLLACAAQGKRLGYDGYRVGPFTGLTICFSGISASKKQALAKQVLAVGGSHSASLDKKCTHLVTVSTESDKYKFARREGIICVQPKWIEDCLARGWCQEEGPYLVAEPSAAQQPSRVADLMPLRHGTSGLPADDATMMSLPAPSSGTVGGCGVSESRGPTSSSRPEEVQQPPPRPPSRLAREGGAAAAPAPAAAAAAAQAVAGGAVQLLIQLSPFDAPAPAQQDDLEWDDDAPMYLDSCKLHLAGCTQSERLEVLRIVKEGAAKRFANLVPGLSHVVVGSDVAPAEAAELVEYAAANRRTAFVALEWLRRCGAEARRLPPDGYAMPASALQGLKRKAPALEQLGSEQRLQRSTSSISAGGSMAFTSGGPLAGCYFTLTALRVLGSAKDEAHCKELILHNGGRVFNANTIAIVPEKARPYALCPHQLLPSEGAQLKSAHPDFKLVDDKQRFTPYWLECSLLAGQPLAPQRGAPLYQPLSFPLPLPGIEGVLICVSGYDPAVRATIKYTVETLGGTVTEALTRRNTHLILPEATGAKYNHCNVFRVWPVTGDWLIDSIAYGRLQPEAGYAPPPPQGGAAGEFGGGGEAGGVGPHSNMPSADTNRSGGMGGASQIGVTQLPGGGGGAAGVPLPTSLFQAVTAGRAAAPAAEQPLAAGAAALAAAATQPLPAGMTGAPPQQQQQAPPPQGEQQRVGGGLRQRMTQGRRASAARRSNDENAAAEAPPNLMDADLAVPAWGGGGTGSQPQRQALPEAQPPLLRECGPGSSGAAQQVASQEPQQQQQQVPGPGPPESLFDQIFGSSSPRSIHPPQQPTQPPPPPQEQQQQPAAAASPPAAAPMRSPPLRSPSQQQRQLVLAPSPASGTGSNAGSRRKSAAGRDSGGPRRTSSRLRPDASAVAAMAVAEAALGQAAGASGVAVLAAAAANHPLAGQQLGSEVQLQQHQQLGGGEPSGHEEPALGSGGEGPDLAQMVDHIGGLLARVAGEPAALGSQHDMPPPPPRNRAGVKRPAEGGGDTEGGVFAGGGGGGTGGGRQTRSRGKRSNLGSGGDTPTEAANGSGRKLRRSGRGRMSEAGHPEMEMSQQVGYEQLAPSELPPVRFARQAGGTSEDAAAKARLQQLARQRSGRSSKADIFSELGLT